MRTLFPYTTLFRSRVTLTIPARVFGRYDAEAAQWTWPAGEFTVAVGRSSRDLRLHTRVALP